MGQLFCTLEQAASRLGVTEPELKEMVADGMLREFRDGACLLLQTSEVETLAVSRDRDVPQRPAALMPAPATTPVSEPGEAGPGTGDATEDLTHSGVATSDAPQEHTTSKKRAATHRRRSASRTGSTSKDKEMEEVLTPAYEPPTYDAPACPLPASVPWPGLQIERPPAWRRLWMGVTQDRPGAVVGLCVVLGVVLAATTICVYLLL